MESPFPVSVAFAWLEDSAGTAPRLLPEEEAALGGGASPRRRAQFALGRACARNALRALGLTAPGPIGKGEGRRPAWPDGIVGSITHSHGRAAAAVAPARLYRGIGVDLERIRLPSDALLRRVCRPEERPPFDGLAADAVALRFTAIFAAKESIYKAVNPLTGVYLGFQDARIEFPPGEDLGTGSSFVWWLEKDGGPRFPAGTRSPGAWRRMEEWILAGVWIAV